jgi:predicted component of type VI protein secretion system
MTTYALGHSSPADVAARLEAEREGLPHLVLRDGSRTQLIVQLRRDRRVTTIGRGDGADLQLHWDPDVSRAHAEIERVGGCWTICDDGLSRNGTFVNGERAAGRRRLRNGDRLCFGETVVRFRAPAEEESRSTAVVGRGGPLTLTETQRKLLVALCRPLRDSAYATPATNREIADELHLSVDAVKAHLRVLFERLAIDGLPQNQKRARLAAVALVDGHVRRHDF